jgi:hypothetical protein
MCACVYVSAYLRECVRNVCMRKCVLACLYAMYCVYLCMCVSRKQGKLGLPGGPPACQRLCVHRNLVNFCNFPRRASMTRYGGKLGGRPKMASRE